MAHHGDDTETLLSQWRERKKGDLAAEGHADPVIDTLLKEMSYLDEEIRVHEVGLASLKESAVTFSARLKALAERRAALSGAVQARLL